MADLFLEQIDSILGAYRALRDRTQMEDMSNLPEHERQIVVTRSIASISRIAGIRSSYAEDIRRIVAARPQLFMHLSQVIGVLGALREDVAAGYVQSAIELAHGEIFSDFLEMAQHLVDSGYKDAAAVVAGSALESHLRALGHKNSVSVTDTKSDGSVVNMKADRINADLAAANIYGKLEQKSITAWLDLRNKAAHGLYGEYVVDQVRLLVDGIRDFILRTPA